MHVATCKIKIFLFLNHNLKSKRKIVKSLWEQIRNKCNISISEIEGYKLWQAAIISIAVISNKVLILNQTLGHLFSFIASSTYESNIIPNDIEIIS